MERCFYMCCFTCAVLHVFFFTYMFYICFLVYCHLTNIYEPVYVIVFSCCLCVWVCFAQAVSARENMKAKYCNLCDLWLNGRFKFVQHLKRCKHHKKAHFWIFSRGIADYVTNLKLRLHVKTKRSGRCVKDFV